MNCIRLTDVRCAFLTCIVLVCLQFQGGFKMVCAQEQGDKSKTEDRLKYMINATSRFEARVGESETPARLDETALFRWTNPPETVVDGLLLLYT
ncbi:MAG: hypothetical protein O2856_10215 [Planctomycetota bacterium]|nr:hypothetical protein [Planctomycetota bacterium]